MTSIVWEGVVYSTLTYIARAPGSVIDSDLLDDLVLSYVHWRGACLTAGAAYEGWRRCATVARSDAYAAFRSALDAEECAAAVYEGVVSRIERLPAAADPAAAVTAPGARRSPRPPSAG